MKKFFKSTLEMVKATKSVTKSNGSMNYNEVAEIKKTVTRIAKHAHMQYLQFIAVGFTEEQAMQLVIAILN